MSTGLTPPLTLDSFLAWEREQDLRYEFDGMNAVAMVGGTVGHGAIATNVIIALASRLQGTPCRMVAGTVKIIVKGRVRYPDVVVTCAAADLGSDVLPEPVVVFEVLSPSTARTDRVAKNEEYRATPSIRHYVILEPDEMAALVFTRDGADWAGRLHAGPSASVPLPALGIDLPLAALYNGIMVG